MNKVLMILFLAFLQITCISITESAERPVVIEDYTATWCGFCFGVNKALEKVDENFKNVVIIEFHVDDEFSFPYTNERSLSYDITGLPSVMFNGTIKKVGGSGKSDGFFAFNQIYNDYEITISNLQEEIAGNQPFDLDVFGYLASENSEMTAVIQSEAGYPNPVEVIFLIVQDNVEFDAANG